ncbi:MAG: nitrogen regulation protein NR(II), partial [Pseudomonadales bacterium]
MQLGITITDLQRKIIYTNPADAKMHGYTVEDLIGEDVEIYAPAARRAALTLEQLMQFTRRNPESFNVRKDGSVFPVQLRSDLVMGVDGEPIGLVTSCEDITERKRAEEQLQGTYRELQQSHLDLQATQLQVIEADKLESMGQLAAGIAHEVKNPLMTLLTGVKFLSKFLPDQTEQVTHLLADMSDAVSRADSVIKGLLDFSAPHKLDRSPKDLNPIVERSLSLVKHELDRSQVTVVKELAKDIPPLLLDSFKIQQVLVNIVTNAVHATPPGGTVTTRTSVRPLTLISGGTVNDAAGQRNNGKRAVFLEVDDTGSGIPDERLSKIFDPFFTTKPAGKGTGLGLSVARQIVEMHGASIDIRNGNEGGV